MVKHPGEDKRMYYEKVAPPSRTMRSRAEPKKKESEDPAGLADIGARISNYLKKLEKRIEDLEKERERLKEKLEVFSKQKEEFKRLYQETEAKSRELSKERSKVANSIPAPRSEGENE
jgi:chromosome segregation ATPase